MKVFDFTNKNNLTISDIKQILNTETFELNRLINKNGDKIDILALG